MEINGHKFTGKQGARGIIATCKYCGLNQNFRYTKCKHPPENYDELIKEVKLCFENEYYEQGDGANFNSKVARAFLNIAQRNKP